MAAPTGHPPGGKVNGNWTFPAFRTVFAGGEGVIYGITASGDVLWYRHDGWSSGTADWAATKGKKINDNWSFPAYKMVFGGRQGIIYGITEAGDVMWHRHDGWSSGALWTTTTAGGKKVGDHWTCPRAISGSEGIIYGIKSNQDKGQMLWYRHDGWSNGEFVWEQNSGTRINEGFTFPNVIASSQGAIYGIQTNGEMLWYRFDGRSNCKGDWAKKSKSLVLKGMTYPHVFAD
jgi:hypothetical protein